MIGSDCAARCSCRSATVIYLVSLLLRIAMNHVPWWLHIPIWHGYRNTRAQPYWEVVVYIKKLVRNRLQLKCKRRLGRKARHSDSNVGAFHDAQLVMQKYPGERLRANFCLEKDGDESRSSGPNG